MHLAKSQSHIPHNHKRALWLQNPFNNTFPFLALSSSHRPMIWNQQHTHSHTFCMHTASAVSSQRHNILQKGLLQAAYTASTFSSPFISSSWLALSPNYLLPAAWQWLPSFSCSSRSRNCGAIHHPPNRSWGKGIVSWTSLFSWRRTYPTKGAVGSESPSGTQHGSLCPRDLTCFYRGSLWHGRLGEKAGRKEKEKENRKKRKREGSRREKALVEISRKTTGTKAKKQT